MFYFKTYSSVKTIETEALSVELLTLHPTFCCKIKGLRANHVLYNFWYTVKIDSSLFSGSYFLPQDVAFLELYLNSG